MTSIFETRTLRYQLRSRGIYTEHTPINSPETLSKHPQTQDDSPNTMQETPNNQFRLFLSVTPCMPRKDSFKSVNRSPSPSLFSPNPRLEPSPRVRRWHNLHIYTSLVSTNRSFEVCSSVDAQPPNTPPWYQLDSEDHQWQTHRLFAILFKFLRYLLSIQWRWCSLCLGLSWQKDRVLLTDLVPLCNIWSYQIWLQQFVHEPIMVAIFYLGQ